MIVRRLAIIRQIFNLSFSKSDKRLCWGGGVQQWAGIVPCHPFICFTGSLLLFHMLVDPFGVGWNQNRLLTPFFSASATSSLGPYYSSKCWPFWGLEPEYTTDTFYFLPVPLLHYIPTTLPYVTSFRVGTWRLTHVIALRELHSYTL